jgi:hypothetical protein
MIRPLFFYLRYNISSLRHLIFHLAFLSYIRVAQQKEIEYNCMMPHDDPIIQIGYLIPRSQLLLRADA